MMADRYIGKDYTVSDIDVRIISDVAAPDSPRDGLQLEWVHYDHVRFEVLSYDAATDLYTVELKTSDQHDGKRVKVSGYFMDLGLGGSE